MIASLPIWQPMRLAALRPETIRDARLRVALRRLQQAEIRRRCAAIQLEEVKRDRQHTARDSASAWGRLTKAEERRGQAFRRVLECLCGLDATPPPFH